MQSGGMSFCYTRDHVIMSQSLYESEVSCAVAHRTPYRVISELCNFCDVKVDADEDRLPRTLEEMEKEATWLRGFFTEDKESHDPNAV
jgi:hypothetical protein